MLTKEKFLASLNAALTSPEARLLDIRDYAAALEEFSCDVEAQLEAAREQIEREERD